MAANEGKVRGRSFGLCLLLAASCATASPAAPVAEAPAPDDARQYYPLEPGWKWAYDVQRGTEQILAVYTVRARQGSQAELQTGEETIRYEVRPEGIARASSTGEEDKRTPSTDYILRSPIRMGSRWPIADGQATITAVGQTITVPAGTFTNCVTVEEAREGPPRLVRTTYAPGVGPVSLDSLVQIPGRTTYESTLRASLRGVNRPGEDPLR
ncbi:MAG TPA: hypothetical protein VGG33_14990 [Polyangia bacterium]